MSAFPELPKRLLVADTETPGAEIAVVDGRGQVVARAVNRLEAWLDPGLYKLRFRVGDAIRDMLMELQPGEDVCRVETPRLPFETAAPITRRGRARSPLAARARELSVSAPEPHGAGSELLIFLDTAADAVPPPLQVRSFDGESIAEVGPASASDPFAGRLLGLDPGNYLLRWGELEQSVVTAAGWQTQVYLPDAGADGEPPDLSAAAVLMCRSGHGFDPDDPGFRSAEVARRALAAGRWRAADDPSLMRSLVGEKFDNPILGILAAHLMLLAEQPDLDLLREVASNLQKLVPGHPDVASLWYFLQDERAKVAVFAQPPMLRSSWNQIIAHGGESILAVPSGSYSARIAASLWGDEAWLTWTVPPAAEPAPPSPNLLADVIRFLGLVGSGGPIKELSARTDLTPAERVLVVYAEGLLGQVDFARAVTAAIDQSRWLGAFLPTVRRFVGSATEKDAARLIETARTPEMIASLTGLPFASIGDAAASLLRKVGSDERVRGVLSQGVRALASIVRRP